VNVGVVQPQPAATHADVARRFGGIARLYGQGGARRIATARIAVVGLGGVGSWAVEALARSGAGDLLLVDLDHVGESNTNRQLHALDGTYGMSKVDAMAQRVTAIHPQAAVRVHDDFVTPDNVAAVLGDAEVVLDCTDQVVAKAAMAAWARALGRLLVVSGAGGGRTDPTRIRRGDLADAVGDPLLASVRHRLRRHHGFPAAETGGRRRAPSFGIAAVWSDEPVRRPAGDAGGDGAATDAVPVDGASCGPEVASTGAVPAGLSCAGYGSVVTVTASIGLAMVALVLDHLAHDPAHAAARDDAAAAG
jgi:tRNA A37 threonylcarbamoyladenosine dehydratase